MLKSMTGFGRAKYQINGREYIIEIKSLNNRYLDISIKMPKDINYIEEYIKNEVIINVSRGKLDINIIFNDYSSLSKSIKINTEIAENYIKTLKSLAKKYKIKDDISAINICKMPEVLEIKNVNDEEVIKQEILIPLTEALNKLSEMKQLEGSKLAKDIDNRLDIICEKVNNISQLSTGLIEKYIVKLEKRMHELLKSNENIDKGILEQEVVIYSDKCSIEEEVIRLKSHIEQFKNIINCKEFVTTGKKLDFIIQEMNRETNTIGSKANCIDITNEVINIKTEIENIREQVQNIE